MKVFGRKRVAWRGASEAAIVLCSLLKERNRSSPFLMQSLTEHRSIPGERHDILTTKQEEANATQQYRDDAARAHTRRARTQCVTLKSSATGDS
jgi:hypothetical protein